MDPKDIVAQYEATQARLDKVSDELKKFAENADAQVKTNGKLSEELKASVDKALLDQAGVNAELNAIKQEVVKLQQGGVAQAPKSVGEMVIESDEFKAFDEGRGGKARFTVKLASLGISPMAKLLEGSDAAGGLLVQPQRLPGVMGLPQQRLTIRDLLTWGRTAVNAIDYVKELGFSNNADVVSENPAAGKPESTITFELDSTKVATIAHWVHASKQVLADAPQLASIIDNRLRYGLALKEEAQLLKGSGVGLNIDGIYTQATAYANPGVTVDTPTKVDILRLAMLQAQLAEYSADGIVLNPIDWTGIELQKDTTHNYLMANPFGIMVPTLWGRPVVSTQSMSSGDFLVGAFKQGAQGWDREDASVTVSTEDRDNFIKNMVTVLGEERIALTVYRPEAFVRGGFAEALS